MYEQNGDLRLILTPSVHSFGWYWEVQEWWNGVWITKDTSIEVSAFKFIAVWEGRRALKHAIRVKKIRLIKPEVVAYHRASKSGS